MNNEAQLDRDARIDDARIDLGAVLLAVMARAPRIILVTLVLMGAAYAVLMFTPRVYESTAAILVEPRTSIYTRATNEPAPSLTGGEAGVVSSQIELLKSRDTLLRVIEELGLRDIPEFNGSDGGVSPLALVGRLLGRGETRVQTDSTVLSILLDRMSVVQQRDSRVITVSVRARDPDLAARIANAVANAHVQRRAELSISDTAEASGWLREEIDRLRVSVGEAERAVAEFRVERDLFEGANNISLLDQQLSTIANQINAAQERRSTAQSRATLIRGLVEQGRSLEGLADIQQSAVIQQLTQERARLQGERAQLSATLLPNHPNVRSITAQIGELDAQLRAEGRQIADALEAEAQIEAGLEASLRAELEALKSSTATATRESVDLQGLMREASAQRDLLESYLRRYNEAITRTDSTSALPDVRVVTLAAPAVNPASPQTTLILLAVGLVALTTQVGIVIFSELLSGRAVRAGAAPVLFTEPPLDEPAPAVAQDAFETPPDAEPVPEDAPLEGEPFEEQPIEEEEAGLPPPVPASHLEDHVRLATDLILGRCRIVLLAGHGSASACEALVEALVEQVSDKGVSLAVIDAGSGRPGDRLGIADLSTGEASFGDVVHKFGDQNRAEVPWGQSGSFERRSARPVTLVEALSDIYEVVIVSTGKLGFASTLPCFAGVADRVVIVSEGEGDSGELETLGRELAEAGYGRTEIVRAPVGVAA